MVSWRRAFIAAGLTVIYSIVWGIVGGLIFTGGFFLMIWTRMAIGGLIGGFFIMLIGYLIMTLGSLASIYKVGTELVVDEIKAIGVVKPMVPEGKLYCPACGVENPKEATCIKCGTPIK